MKYLPLVLLVLPVLFMSFLAEENSVETDAAVVLVGEQAPVAVLELFTSQGCSSCPPADALLEELDRRAEAGENIIALSFHVDYWNYLGWSDPFSSAWYSARQTDYTDRLEARTYTPQLIVNGQTEMIGSRKTEVKSAVEKALKKKTSFAPSLLAEVKEGKVLVSYTIDGNAEGHRVTALLVQPRAESAVKRGENRGKDLHHVNVVRVMEHQDAAPSGMLKLVLPPGEVELPYEVVLLVQDKSSLAIAGAKKVSLDLP